MFTLHRGPLAAVIGAVALTLTPIPTTPAAASGTPDPVTAPVAAKRVPLPRLQLPAGSRLISGDGTTEYVANGTVFRPRGPVTAPPAINARAWAVMDLDTGRMLGKHNPRKRLPMASTIKLLTALTALDTVPVRPRHKVTRFETNQTCSCAGIEPGRTYTRRALLAGMLLPSGNDAAEALAGAHPLGRRAFYAAMNAKARELGATGTRVSNASGLTAERGAHHSTARDLLVIAQAAAADPRLHRILSQTSAPLRTLRGQVTGRVVRKGDYVNTYPTAWGKSGYTTPAQNTLVVTDVIDGRRLGVVTLGAPGGYSTSGTRALAVWAATNRTGLAGVGPVPNPVPGADGAAVRR